MLRYLLILTSCIIYLITGIISNYCALGIRLLLRIKRYWNWKGGDAKGAGWLIR